MRVCLPRSFVVFSLVVSLSLMQPTVTHASMLGDLWGSIVSFFTGKKKTDPALEQQIKLLLEATNQSQNSLIASINDIQAYQKNKTDFNQPGDREKMDQMMLAMQQSIETNQDNFLKMMQAREQLSQAGQLEIYEQNFQQFIQKQQEIEGYYPKIEDRYNELIAFSESVPTESSDGTNSSSSASQSEEIKSSREPWNDPAMQGAIDKYLMENGLDEWGGPKVENAKIGRPPGAVDRSRYQYVWEANIAMREALKGMQESITEENYTSNDQIAKTETSNAPASPQNSLVKPTSAKVPRTNMAFSNRYDNIDIRNQRQQIYSKLIQMQADGLMNSEDYKDLYHQYTILGQQLNRATK